MSLTMKQDAVQHFPAIKEALVNGPKRCVEISAITGLPHNRLVIEMATLHRHGLVRLASTEKVKKELRGGKARYKYYPVYALAEDRD